MLAHELAGQPKQNQSFAAHPKECLSDRFGQADAAIQLVLHAAGRQSVGDFIELMQMDRTVVSLGIAIWAASGRDKSFTPDFLLDRMRRNSIINPVSRNGVTLPNNQTPVTIKKDWLDRFAAAAKLIASIPFETIGCLYLNANGQPARGEIYDLSWVPHYGSVKGAWPKLV